MISVQRLTALFRADPHVKTTNNGFSARQTDMGPDADHIVLAGLVQDAFRTDPMLHGARIRVEAFMDVVQLSGFAKSQADISRAVALASGVDGVTSIRNCMQLA